MKVVCWDVQGAKKPHLRLEVGFITRTINPDILFMLETMVKEQNAESIITTLGFSHHERIPSTNHCGGIWCFWNPVNVDVTIITKDNRAIHCSVADMITNKHCILTAVYAPAQSAEKEVFWPHLQQLNESFTLPWCIIGDFDELLDSSNKIGGGPLLSNRT